MKGGGKSIYRGTGGADGLAVKQRQQLGLGTALSSELAATPIPLLLLLSSLLPAAASLSYRGDAFLFHCCALCSLCRVGAQQQDARWIDSAVGFAAAQ